MTLLHQAAQKAVEARRSFEAWYEADAMPSEADWFKRDPDAPDEYDSAHTHVAWKAWQAALQQQPEPEWVAQVVSSGPHGFPLLEWRSANHSLETAIGTKLYTAPPALQERRRTEYTPGGLPITVVDDAPALQQQEVPREPVLPHTPLLEQALSAMADVQEQAEPGFEPDVAIIPASDWRVFVDAHAELSMLWTTWRDSPGWAPLDDPAASPSTTRQQEVGSVPPAKLVNGQWEGAPLSQFPELQEQVRKGLADGSIQIGCGDASVEWTPEDEKRLDDALAKRAAASAAAPSTPENAGGVKGTQ